MDIRTLNKFALNNTLFTPDIATLELMQFQLVFVCDDLMRAGKNYDIIKDCSAFVTRAFTERSYNFYRKRTDGTAVVVNIGTMETGSYKIKGEVHSVLSSELVKLDKHYQNGVQFKRYRTKLLYPTTPTGVLQNQSEDGKPLPKSLQGEKRFTLPERVDPLEAWMYIGLRSYWNDLLDGGFAFEPVRLAEPAKERNWLPKYYHWKNQP
jgi:hypothetical protein